MIPIPVVIAAAVIAVVVAAGRWLEHLVVRDRSWLWQAVVVAAAIDAAPAAITGNWLARIAVLIGVDAGWQLLDGRVPSLPRRKRHTALPDNVIPLRTSRPHPS